MQSRGKRAAFLGVFLALALVLSYVESLIPVIIPVPGIKLGLTNIIIVLMLYTMGAKEALAVSVLRVILAGFLFGNLASIIYSLAGGLLSFGVMALLKKAGRLHIITVSAIGGVSHNLGQVIVAALVVENVSVMYYFPVLMIAGVITGVVIGIVANELIKRVGKYIRLSK